MRALSRKNSLKKKRKKREAERRWYSSHKLERPQSPDDSHLVSPERITPVLHRSMPDHGILAGLADKPDKPTTLAQLADKGQAPEAIPFTAEEMTAWAVRCLRWLRVPRDLLRQVLALCQQLLLQIDVKLGLAKQQPGERVRLEFFEEYISDEEEEEEDNSLNSSRPGERRSSGRFAPPEDK
eukprot:g1237.t1